MVLRPKTLAFLENKSITLDRKYSYFELICQKFHSLLLTHIFTHKGAFQQLFAFDIKQTYTFMTDFPNT